MYQNVNADPIYQFIHNDSDSFSDDDKETIPRGSNIINSTDRHNHHHHHQYFHHQTEHRNQRNNNNNEVFKSTIHNEHGAFGIVIVILIVLIIVLFVGLMLYRTDFSDGENNTNEIDEMLTESTPISSKFWKIIAKNSAAMTVGIFMLFFFVCDEITTNNESLSKIIHVSMVVCYLIFAAIHTICHVVMVFENYFIHDQFTPDTLMMIKYCSGITLLLFVCVVVGFTAPCVSYNLFYYVHVIGTFFVLITSVIHSYYFGVAFLYYTLVVWLARIIRRNIKIDVAITFRGKSFVFVGLTIKRTIVSKLLLINKLKKNNGNCNVWLICKNINTHERHPFTVIYTKDSESSSTLLLLISKYGDWKKQLYNLIKTNEPHNLHNDGLHMSIESCRSGDMSLYKCDCTLFLLERVGISSFFSFLEYLLDADEVHRRDRLRTISLHWLVDDLSYLRLLETYMLACDAEPSLRVHIQLYVDCECFVYRHTKTVHTSRLPYIDAVHEFLNNHVAEATNKKLKIYTNISSKRPTIRKAVNRYLNKSKKVQFIVV